MTYRLLITALLAVGLAHAQTHAQAQVQPDNRPGVAVFHFEDGGWMGVTAEDRQAWTTGFQQLLLYQLANNTNLRIVDRNILQAALKEIGMDTMRVVDPETAAKAGKIVGAKYAVLGTFTDVGGSRPMILGRIVSVETTEVLKAVEANGKKDELYPMIVDVAARVTSGVNLPALPAILQRQIEQRAQRISPEAVTLFTRAQFYEDAGRMPQATQLYEQVVSRFPDMLEAKDALNKIRNRG